MLYQRNICCQFFSVDFVRKSIQNLEAGKKVSRCSFNKLLTLTLHFLCITDLSEQSCVKQLSKKSPPNKRENTKCSTELLEVGLLTQTSYFSIAQKYLASSILYQFEISAVSLINELSISFDISVHICMRDMFFNLLEILF